MKSRIKKFLLKSIQVFLVCLVVLGGGFYTNSEVKAKTYKVIANCRAVSQNACCGCRGGGRDISWPSPIVSNCPVGFGEFHYADRDMSTAVSIPADYNSASSDPWVSSTNLSKTTTLLLVGNTATFSLYDDDGNIIASANKTNTNAHTTMKCIYFSCGYRICSALAPTCTLTASSASANAGDLITLNWTTANATDADLDGDNTIALSGSTSYTMPAATITNVLTANQEISFGLINTATINKDNIIDCVACDGSTTTALARCQQEFLGSTRAEFRDCVSAGGCGAVCPAYSATGSCVYNCFSPVETTTCSVTVDVCAPDCSTSIGGCLLADPDPGNTSVTGDECCGVGQCYECNTGAWNGSVCAALPPLPLPDFIEGGIVPCGRYADNPATSWDETAMCNFCHLVMMMQRIINFLLTIMITFALLALIVSGFLFVTSAGDVERRNQAKTGLKYSIGGFIIILICWIIIDFFLIAFGYIDPLGGEWNVVDCDII